MNKVVARIAADRELLSTKATHERFGEILARFEQEFGVAEEFDQPGIRWCMLEYYDSIGIAYVLKLAENITRLRAGENMDGIPIQRRIAYKFRTRTCTKLHEEAAIEHLRAWIKNPQCPPGVEDDNILEGNEINVAEITLDPRAEWLQQQLANGLDPNRIILVEP